MFMQDRLRLVSSIIYHVIIKLMSDIILVLVLIKLAAYDNDCEILDLHKIIFLPVIFTSYSSKLNPINPNPNHNHQSPQHTTYTIHHPCFMFVGQSTLYIYTMSISPWLCALRTKMVHISMHAIFYLVSRAFHLIYLVSLIFL